jgi:enolase
VQVDLTTETGTFRASVPSGASTGRYEALELRDGDRTRYMGKGHAPKIPLWTQRECFLSSEAYLEWLSKAFFAGVLAAIHNIHTKLLPAVLGMDPADQAAVDQRLIDTDGTAAKSAIGANALLAVSLAAAKAGAAALNRPIYLHIADLARRSGLERRSAKLLLPVPWFNVINGGAHAGNRLAVQVHLAKFVD